MSIICLCKLPVIHLVPGVSLYVTLLIPFSPELSRYSAPKIAIFLTICSHTHNAYWVSFVEQYWSLLSNDLLFVLGGSIHGYMQISDGLKMVTVQMSKATARLPAVIFPITLTAEEKKHKELQEKYKEMVRVYVEVSRFTISFLRTENHWFVFSFSL